MEKRPASRELGLLALHRIGCLRPSERLLLRQALDAGVDLSVLSLADLEALVGRGLRLRRWEPRRLLALAEADAERLSRLGARYISFDDPEYPALLREIHDPSAGLFLRGRLPPPELPAVAVVGTRDASSRGVAEAVAFGRDLAAAGLPVISGLARGIDGAAHRGSLSARGFTLAVLPRGIDGAYPASHRGLAAAILDAGGGLLSEYPPGEEALRYRFPERNRIIAGLCRALVVVEAPLGSGALISADFALEGGREVYVASALLGSARAAGIERLAEDGAGRLAEAGALLEAWGIRSPAPMGNGEGLSLAESAEAAPETGAALAAALRAELGLGTRGPSGIRQRVRGAGRSSRRRTGLGALAETECMAAGMVPADTE